MDIEFGEIQQNAPQVGLPPDRDARFVVREIGDLRPDDLRIFVDLDVMRDMEAHAHSNRKVELGGVLLGKQQIDSVGKPYVFVFESLRAEHYEATKGSFKFTHDTWAQITRDRAKFHPDLDMVGWYHTHPGWSVFLSGMDLFICQHFFNRPLDVALVIDPCNDDRGWFQWSDSQGNHSQNHSNFPQPKPQPLTPPPKSQLESAMGRAADPTADPAADRTGKTTDQPNRNTLQTGGFLLVTSRLRQQELDYFAAIYQQRSTMNQDPRYIHYPSTPPSPMIQFPDSQQPFVNIALLSMMLMQFALVALISWKLITAPVVTGEQSLAAEFAGLTDKLERLIDPTDSPQNSPQMQAYQEVLSNLVAAQTGDDRWVEQFTQLRVEHQQLASHLKAQTWLANNLEQKYHQLEATLVTKNEQNERLSKQLQATREELSQTNQQLQVLKQSGNNRTTIAESLTAAEDITSTPTSTFELPWWLAWGAGIGVLGVGSGVGFFLGQRKSSSPHFIDQDETNPKHEN